MTRRENLLADDRMVAFPPLDCCEYLLSYLYEVGPVVAGNELTHEELGKWQENIGLSLQPWEARFLKALSREHLVQMSRSTDPACPAPFGGVERPANLDSLIDEAFG